MKISRGTIKDKSECTYAIYDIDRKGYVELKDIKRAIRVMMPRMESNSVDEYERLSVECMNFLDVRKIGRISKGSFNSFNKLVYPIDLNCPITLF